MGSKKRIDVVLVERGLAESRNQAQRLVMAGLIRVNGERIHKSSQMVTNEADITVEEGLKYVSRGGEKLEGALEDLQLEVVSFVCADVGSSTGGFSDCLLQSGASKVYAIDVGKGLLHWRLRGDPRIILLESTNARYLQELPEPIDLAVVDVSFISLKHLLAPIASWLKPSGALLALVKPQFEAGREAVEKGGVVKDPSVHYQVVRSVGEFAHRIGLYPVGLRRSRLTGPKGNVEFFLYCRVSGESLPLDALLDSVFGNPE